MSDPGSHRGPSVGAIVVTQREGRVLVVMQASGPFAGHWLLPGGAVERDETVGGGARRELLEETGLALEDPRLVAVYEVMSEPRGAFDIVLFMYEGTALGDPKAEAGSQVRWLDPNEAGLHPAMRRQLFDARLREDDPLAMAADLLALGARMFRLA
ncbi:MAG TPA: NUDIX hydrolase [Candidatus Limnocylindria bacterium]|nr:NUDIX hydrolase [Candidatus Limnocylindria bacterium]